jgi:uncharacterized membrane protein
MKIVLALIVALVIVVAVVFTIASRIPKHHTASVSALIARPPVDVYAVLRDVSSSPQWRKEVQRVELLEGNRFREHAKYATVTYEVIDDAPNDHFQTRIVDQNLGYSGSWTYRFAPENGGTRVTITEDGEVSNLIFRFLSRFVFGYDGTMKKVLAALAVRFDTAPRPSAVPSRVL